MTQTTVRAGLLKDVPPEVVIGMLREGEGHTIWDAKFLMDVGLPDAFVKKVTRKYESDGTPKGSISRGGRIVKSMVGAYDLDVIYAVCNDLGIKATDTAMGRGFRYRQILANVIAHFGWGQGNEKGFRYVVWQHEAVRPEWGSVPVVQMNDYDQALRYVVQQLQVFVTRPGCPVRIGITETNPETVEWAEEPIKQYEVKVGGGVTEVGPA